MYIWKLSRNAVDDQPSWETLREIVVTAPTEYDARELAASRSGDEGSLVWRDRDRDGVSVSRVGVSTDPEVGKSVLCADFRER
jgi:hypothetical protein